MKALARLNTRAHRRVGVEWNVMSVCAAGVSASELVSILSLAHTCFPLAVHVGPTAQGPHSVEHRVRHRLTGWREAERERHLVI